MPCSPLLAGTVLDSRAWDTRASAELCHGGVKILTCRTKTHDHFTEKYSYKAATLACFSARAQVPRGTVGTSRKAAGSSGYSHFISLKNSTNKRLACHTCKLLVPAKFCSSHIHKENLPNKFLWYSVTSVYHIPIKQTFSFYRQTNKQTNKQANWRLLWLEILVVINNIPPTDTCCKRTS